MMIDKSSNKLKLSKKGSCYILLLFLGLLCSCIKDDDSEALPASRTVLIYLVGDNDMSGSLSAVVGSVCGGWRYTGNNCLIYLDPADAPPKLLRVRGGCRKHPTPYVETIASYPEENSASAETFSKIIDKVVAKYPAPSYGLIFASHATGWLPAGTLANPDRVARSVGSDMNPTTVGGESQEMEIADFAQAIPDGMFDFIIFETCMMAGVEVAYELRNKTDYMLASSAELLVPGFVPIYGESQHYLFDTKLTVEQSLAGFASDYLAYINTQSGAYRSATLSVVKTSELDSLATLLNGVPLAGVSLNHTQHFDRPGSYGEATISPRYFDLLHTMQQILSTEHYNKIEAQLKKTVVYKVATPTILIGYNGFEVKHHCGLTTYIEQPLFPKLNNAYRNTLWYKAIHN